MKPWLLAFLIGALAPLDTGADTVAGEKVLFQEEFTGQIDKGWTWLREDPAAWRLENGSLVLRPSPEGLHDYSGKHARYSKNSLFRPLPNSSQPLAVEVHVEGEPQLQYEHAGPVWYVDDDNFVSLFQENISGKVTLQMVTFKDGKGSYIVVPYEPRGVWIRLVMAAGKITTLYRASEKDEWSTVGKSDAPVPGGAARVGLEAGGAPKEMPREVSFRSFRILELAGGK